ncbi:hypothetical protein CEUSTIGMA_g10312.t1 [Chlamydomonas eustigma]|uniref:Uncharacterized protein n=1 Tax=Chlamydomonas eustigma TaxID=1157962 RepID=A0A250XIN9_9CHLO|nr:hypothetical protein CEUSTIGMA_g10312.t1 [Chlamydomonas eustigma]|eukprot:GAX82886.1 hypothetical protein CEUSTIGMA_g10312.t1 [Chlamydomonas eustigma]
MGYHRIPPIAIRLGLNRGFESAWYADGNNYAKLLQKDWLITRAAWSYVQRSSRNLPKSQLTREQQLQLLYEQRRMIEGDTLQAVNRDAVQSSTPKKQQKDYPNFRVGRVFLQHLPYKTYASTFAYMTPKDGPQAKYGLFPSKIRK